MTSRRAQVVGVALIAVGLGVFLAVRSSPEAHERPAPAGTANPLPLARPGAEPSAPLPAAHGFASAAAAEVRPGEAMLTPQAEGALISAERRFAFAALPAVDGCLGRAPGPRALRPVLVDFHREGGATEGVRLVADHLKLVGPTPGAGAVEQQDAIERCLAGLAGRDLVVPPEVTAVPERVSRIVNMLLPDPTRVEAEEERR